MENKGGPGGPSLHDGPRRGKNPDFNNNNILRILCACASADVGKRVTMSVSTKAPVSHLFQIHEHARLDRHLRRRHQPITSPKSTSEGHER